MRCGTFWTPLVISFRMGPDFRSLPGGRFHELFTWGYGDFSADYVRAFAPIYMTGLSEAC